ncbi:MAG: AMP-binding protein, partial [Betaproteobacteria bacterium]
MIDWQHHVPLPAMRTETHFGDRVLRCFVDRPLSFYAMLARAVSLYPDQEALVCNQQRWTYRALNNEVDRVAAGMVAHGISAGERVVMFIGNRPEFVAVLFALQKIGAIAVPVGTREQGPGLAYILQQCGAAAIVLDESLLPRLPEPAAVSALRLGIVIADDQQLKSTTASASASASSTSTSTSSPTSSSSLTATRNTLQLVTYETLQGQPHAVAHV